MFELCSRRNFRVIATGKRRLLLGLAERDLLEVLVPQKASRQPCPAIDCCREHQSRGAWYGLGITRPGSRNKFMNSGAHLTIPWGSGSKFAVVRQLAHVRY